MKKPASGRQIRVFLVDDHPIVLSGVRTGLEEDRHIEVVGEASSGAQALRKIKQVKPDVVVMDISLPDTNGMKLTQKLRELLPEVKVLAFTMHEDKEYVLEMFKSGATGYMLKTTSPKELALGIETVFGGGTFYSAQVSKLLADELVAPESNEKGEAHLTWREEEILARVAMGLTSKAIAAELEIGVRTVDDYREKIMRKLDIHTAIGLTRYAIAKGLMKT